jgi:hypothetical protein
MIKGLRGRNAKERPGDESIRNNSPISSKSTRGITTSIIIAVINRQDITGYTIRIAKAISCSMVRK